MISYIVNNLGTIVISAILLAIVTAVCVNLIRKRRKSESSCGCGCSGCSISSICHKE
ncbi:MAG TPA: FeoB-associated Cys-rich membrane protein [Thermoclostridium sp.]